MRYGHRLPNKGLFPLGCYQAFWLIVRLNPWTISLPKTDPQLCDSDEDLNLEDDGVLGLRYKRIDTKTRETLFFFPPGHILYAEYSSTAKQSDFDMIEWMYSPYVLAAGIQSNSDTEVDDHTKEARFYSIYSPAASRTAGHPWAADSDEDTQNIDLCHCQPPYSVARVQFSSDIFLAPDYKRMVTERDYITFKPLSDSRDVPEMVETVLSRGSVRTGLFPL